MIHDRLRDAISAGPVGVNFVGLRRGGFSAETIRKLKEAHRILFRDFAGSVDAAIRPHLEAAGVLCPEVEELLAFLERKARGRFGRQLEPARH
jgi:acyl-[acyl carrier protein]--UDP-N-acetylglucosamine O-acyltransferase